MAVSRRLYISFCLVTHVSAYIFQIGKAQVLIHRSFKCCNPKGRAAKFIKMSDSDTNIPFPDIDPYEVLGVNKSVTEKELKKCYRKLMLRCHPDKTKDWTPEAKEKFHKIQFAFEVLDKFKETYDKTGSVEACFKGSDFADWKDLFDMDVAINKDTIAADKAVYRGSTDESQDIRDSWQANAQGKVKKRYNPDEDQFTLLFQEVPHIEANESDEAYLFNLVSELLKKGEITDSDGSFERWTKNRKKYLRALQKKLAKEEKLAEEMLSQMEEKNAVSDEAELKRAIQKKNKNSFDSLISRLESQAKSKNKRRKHAELDDEEFEKIRSKISKKRG